MRKFLGLLLAVVTIGGSALAADEFKIDSVHSSVNFSVTHMSVSTVNGRFTDFEGKIIFDDKDPSKSSVTVKIKSGSINTDNSSRDGDLKSAKYFDVEKFPNLHFKSTGISLVRDGELAIEGDLTIRGVTRKVRFEVEGPTPPTKDPWGNTRVGVSATTKINRKDFGLTWNAALETGGILVGDDVTITLEAEFVKA